MNNDLRNVQELHLRVDSGVSEILCKDSMKGSTSINPRCSEVFNELKLRRKSRYVIYKINDGDIDVDVIGDRNHTFDDLKKLFPYTECRYCVYDQEVTTFDGRKTNKLWFISWFPTNSHTYMKMAYTQAKVHFRETLPGVFDMNASTIAEIEASIGIKDDEEEDQDFDD